MDPEDVASSSEGVTSSSNVLPHLPHHRLLAGGSSS
jgi:hypothetical protein